MRIPNRIGALVCLIAVAALSACVGKTPPSKFYLMSSMLDSGAVLESSVAEEALSIGIGPVEMPKYLDRPQIVTRTQLNELMVDEFHRWAGQSPQAGFTRVLAENLGVLLRTNRISFHPWQRATPIDVQVSIVVLRFDTDSDGKVALRALWKLLRDDGRELLSMHGGEDFTDSADKLGDHSSMVTAESRVIEQLSRSIAEDISNLQAQGRLHRSEH
jgi:uncharacterized lipoprotein YmbA